MVTFRASGEKGRTEGLSASASLDEASRDAVPLSTVKY
jgi:hypothetical protein